MPTGVNFSAFVRHSLDGVPDAVSGFPGCGRTGEAILHQADAARARVHEAEIRLQAAIDAVLIPEQRAKRCLLPHRP